MILDSKGREVELDVYGKYEDDIQIGSAYYVDDGSDVTDDEIDYIMDVYADKLYDMWLDKGVTASDMMYDIWVGK